MKLTEHFTLEELTVTTTRLFNQPPPQLLNTIKHTAEQLERVRELLCGNPIKVSSAYRSPQVNAAVGGSATSAHCKGYAVDFTCPGFGTPEQVVRALMGKLKYDQLIWEHPPGRNPWVHISFDPRYRQQTLEFVGGKNYPPLQ